MDKVKTGENIVIKASTWNAFIDAANYVKEHQGNMGNPVKKIEPDSVFVTVKNDTEKNFAIYSCLFLDDLAIFPDEDDPETFHFQPVVFSVSDCLTSGVKANNKLCILQEPLKAGAVGRAMVIGITHARVNVKDVEHCFAIPSGNGKLVSDEYEGIPIAWMDGIETGEQEVVLLLNGNCADIFPSSSGSSSSESSSEPSSSEPSSSEPSSSEPSSSEPSSSEPSSSEPSSSEPSSSEPSSSEPSSSEPSSSEPSSSEPSSSEPSSSEPSSSEPSSSEPSSSEPSSSAGPYDPPSAQSLTMTVNVYEDGEWWNFDPIVLNWNNRQIWTTEYVYDWYQDETPSIQLAVLLARGQRPEGVGFDLYATLPENPYEGQEVTTYTLNY